MSTHRSSRTHMPRRHAVLLRTGAVWALCVGIVMGALVPLGGAGSSQASLLSAQVTSAIPAQDPRTVSVLAQHTVPKPRVSSSASVQGDSQVQNYNAGIDEFAGVTTDLPDDIPTGGPHTGVTSSAPAAAPAGSPDAQAVTAYNGGIDPMAGMDSSGAPASETPDEARERLRLELMSAVQCALRKKDNISTGCADLFASGEIVLPRSQAPISVSGAQPVSAGVFAHNDVPTAQTSTATSMSAARSQDIVAAPESDVHIAFCSAPQSFDMQACMADQLRICMNSGVTEADCSTKPLLQRMANKECQKQQAVCKAG